MSDQNKKTLRAFQCREYLWEVFERMSAELDCSVDYLINESMRQYARSRGVRTSRVSLGPSFSAPPEAGRETPTVPPARASRPSIPVPAPAIVPQVAEPPRSPAAPPLVSPGLAPPPLPSMVPPAPAPQAAPRAPLYIVFNGQKYLVDKDEFVLGRSSKTSDFTIKDNNISRRHALVVYQNGKYYMKDLGSTNGIDFAGQRVGTKLIDEGDVFRVCDYEISFTYQ